MTPARIIPTQRRGRDRRQQILREAARLIARDGYDAVTSAQIAAAAEVPIGSFYRYFESKEAAFIELAALLQLHSAMSLDNIFSGPIFAAAGLDDRTQLFIGHLVGLFSANPLAVHFLRPGSHTAFNVHGAALRGLYQERFARHILSGWSDANGTQSQVAFETTAALAQLIYIAPLDQRAAVTAEALVVVGSYLRQISKK